MITTLLSTDVVTTLIPSIADNATKTLAFNKIENPFIGILSVLSDLLATTSSRTLSFRTGWHSSAASVVLLLLLV